MTVPIEYGKYYLTGSGMIVGPMEICSNRNYPFQGVVVRRPNSPKSTIQLGDTETFLHDGRYFVCRGSEYDIVSECQPPPAPPYQVIRDNRKTKMREFFAENGDMLCRVMEHVVETHSPIDHCQPWGHYPALPPHQQSALMVRLYNHGYMAGHQDSVEGAFVLIHHTEMSTYHADVVAEILQEEGT